MRPGHPQCAVRHSRGACPSGNGKREPRTILGGPRSVVAAETEVTGSSPRPAHPDTRINPPLHDPHFASRLRLGGIILTENCHPTIRQRERKKNECNQACLASDGGAAYFGANNGKYLPRTTGFRRTAGADRGAGTTWPMSCTSYKRGSLQQPGSANWSGRGEVLRHELAGG